MRLKLRTMESLSEPEKELYERWRYNATHPMSESQKNFFKQHMDYVYCPDIVRLVLEDDYKVIGEQGDYDSTTVYHLGETARLCCSPTRNNIFWLPTIIEVWIARCLNYKNKGFYYQLPQETKGLERDWMLLYDALGSVFFNSYGGPPMMKEIRFRRFAYSVQGVRDRWSVPLYTDTNFLLLLTLLDYCGFAYIGPVPFSLDNPQV
ncbi:MAG: hypothetical protein J6R42_02510 [Clostridia bacterium]|nr:hypothetical protein [Clostridia bacterium]